MGRIHWVWNSDGKEKESEGRVRVVADNEISFVGVKVVEVGEEAEESVDNDIVR